MKLDAELVGTGIAFLLTLMVYAYLAKDLAFFRAIYRVAVYLFIGVALGYAALMAWHTVLKPRFLDLLLGQGQVIYAVPLVLCLLLLAKFVRPWRGLGNVTIAFLFGVGAALAIGGGIVGTLLPQIEATAVSLNPAHYQGISLSEGNYPWLYALNAFFIVLGTISTLLYFYFQTGGGSQRVARILGPVIEPFSQIGKLFIMTTFGALFATTAISRISLLVDRVRFLVSTLLSFFPQP